MLDASEFNDPNYPIRVLPRPLVALLQKAEPAHRLSNMSPHGFSRASYVFVPDCLVNGGMLLIVDARTCRDVNALIGLRNARANMFRNENYESRDKSVVAGGCDRPVELYVCVDRLRRILALMKLAQRVADHRKMFATASCGRQTGGLNLQDRPQFKQIGEEGSVPQKLRVNSKR